MADLDICDCSGGENHLTAEVNNRFTYFGYFLKKVPSIRGRTYVMITYVSKENNLGPGDKIKYIWGLKGPIFIL